MPPLPPLPPSPTPLASPAATAAAAASLAACLEDGAVLALHGDLGSGKTVFTRGLAHALGITEPITSPTFALVHEYQGPRGRFYHLDLYRLERPEQALSLGLDEFLGQPGTIPVIEWADRLAGQLPPGHIEVRLQHLGGRRRGLAWARHT
jgi:tRNA threonylcarbamoyladenosine biosynthesis protein TsaE